MSLVGGEKRTIIQVQKQKSWSRIIVVDLIVCSLMGSLLVLITVIFVIGLVLFKSGLRLLVGGH